MAYTTINKSTDYFRTKLYNGNNNVQNITWDETDVNMKPDFLWIKSRAGATVFDHVAGNVASGSGKYVKPNTTDAEVSNSNVINTFNTNGFSVGGATFVSEGGRTYVGWGWKGAGSTSSNTDGSISSTVSANTTSGFSVVSYTGNGTSGATIGHGLSSAPSMIIFKSRSSVNSWLVYHKSVGATKYLRLETSDTASVASSVVNDTAPTSSIITLGDSSGVNDNGVTFIAYCFAEKTGYSKFGSYTGNGSADGTFIYTGFKPTFVMTKRTDVANDWNIQDTKRQLYNGQDGVSLQANTSSSESDIGTGYEVDFLSNGFKRRNSGSETNASGGTYIYMAFAENPLVGTNGVTAKAR